MEFTTPSEKTRTYTNPSPIQKAQKIIRNPFIVGLKNISGTPIPFLMALFCTSIFISTLLTQVLALGISALVFIYIVIDRFSRQQEFSFFRLGTDIPLLLFLLLGVSSQLLNSPADLIPNLDYILSFLFLYSASYSLNLFPGLNRNINIIIISAFLLSCLGIAQYQGVLFHWDWLNSYSKIHFLHQIDKYYPLGFFNQSLLFGSLICLSLPIVVASFFQLERKKSLIGILFFILFIVLFSACIITWDIRIWIAACFSTLITSFLIKKRYFLLTSISLFIIFGAYFQYNSTFRVNTITAWHQYLEIKQIEDLKWETNLKSIGDNLWLGTGLVHANYNNAGLSSKYENSFLKLILQTGVLGSLCFGFFIVSCIFNCLNLLREIPTTHYWHKVYIYSCLGCISAFLILSLGSYIIGNPNILFLFLFLLATQHHIMEAYGRGFVPDDHAI